MHTGHPDLTQPAGTKAVLGGRADRLTNKGVAFWAVAAPSGWRPGRKGWEVTAGQHPPGSLACTHTHTHRALSPRGRPALGLAFSRSCLPSSFPPPTCPLPLPQPPFLALPFVSQHQSGPGQHWPPLGALCRHIHCWARVQSVGVGGLQAARTPWGDLGGQCNL